MPKKQGDAPMDKFILSCESTVDLPYSHISQRNIPVIFYTYNIDGVDYQDDMGKDPDSLKNFYKMLDEGAKPTTSQINLESYLEFFKPLVQQANVLHIAFGSGMSSSVFNAQAAAQQLNNQSKNKIVVIDSTCSCSGYGMLVDSAADLRDEGKSMDEIIAWLNANLHKLHHQFFSTELSFFKRSGRVSATKAFIGTMLGICPIMHLNYDGKIVAYANARGKKKAVLKTISEMVANIPEGTAYSGKCYISHSNFLEFAQEIKEKIMNEFPNIQEPQIFDIGPVITSHCGPGTVAVFFYGKDRARD